MATKTRRAPIRLIFGQAGVYQRNILQPATSIEHTTFVYEQEGGRAGHETIRTSMLDLFIRFIDTGESELVWEMVEEKKMFGGVERGWRLAEIHIRRDFQTGLR